MNPPKLDSRASVKIESDGKENRADNSVQSEEYSESDEESKNPGAALGLIMGVYPAILIAGILLSISIIGIGSIFRSRTVQSEPEPPTATSLKEPEPENLNSK